MLSNKKRKTRKNKAEDAFEAFCNDWEGKRNLLFESENRPLKVIGKINEEVKPMSTILI